VRAVRTLNTAMFSLTPGLEWRAARGGLGRGGCPGCGSGCARRGALSSAIAVASVLHLPLLARVPLRVREHCFHAPLTAVRVAEVMMW
jgi:hypothetical protein